MLHHRKISTTEVRGKKRFSYSQSDVVFWFWPLFGIMIEAPPGCSTFRTKIFINSVIILSLKNIFKVQGGIRWQFFPVKMRSVYHWANKNKAFSFLYLIKSCLIFVGSVANLMPDKKKEKKQLREFVAGSLIQADGTLEFQDGLWIGNHQKAWNGLQRVSTIPGVQPGAVRTPGFLWGQTEFQSAWVSVAA